MSRHPEAPIRTTFAVLAAAAAVVAGCERSCKPPKDALWKVTTWAGTPNLPAQAARDKPVVYLEFNLDRFRSPDTQSIELPLPDGTSIHIQKTGEEGRSAGRLIWQGQVEGDARSMATFSIAGDFLTGKIMTSSGKLYRVDQLEVGKHVLYELNPLLFSAGADPLGYGKPPPPPPPPGSIASESPCPQDVPGNIEVMVVYTEAACASTFAGETLSSCTPEAKQDIENKIDAAKGETNTIFEKSLATPRISVVHVASVGGYLEGENIEQDLDRLRLAGDVEKLTLAADQAHIDDVLNWRNQHGADVVSLITKPSVSYPDTQPCGYSVLMAVNDAWFQKHAFSVVPVDCLAGYLSFTHELGHVLGADHDAEAEVQLSSLTANRGFVKLDPSSTKVLPWRTLMAEDNTDCTGKNPDSGCVLLPYLSNPDLKHEGDDMGSDEARNSAVVSSTAGTVAKYRRSLSCDNS
jgi:hypothetical protein